ncbi:hypothetical protein KHS38_01380 [Mucilaginibacter sp. Bleaf8]|uniref:hypothetical protein n=1 Tax=Mucilaginibacter sp. Bleaf8 TaxID=2834430 RepID=UPI001BCD1B10|nr:hypothetical protein [Mucilaginibacter sp. Bleaf8]MBS7563042.1 hypothetical protein [Mucilaginibacter sp. Bleaf8]
MPGVNIPILEVKSGSLSVPVSISYDAGGRKVLDQTGPLAIGWVINAGGRISRTIHGKSGENITAHLKRAAELDQRIQSDFEYIGMTGQDNKYDIFSYNYGSTSGKFIFFDSQPILIQPKPILIERGDGFPEKIVDEKGIEYTFTSQELSYVQSANSPITSKLLTSIISANKKDTVLFAYKAFGVTDPQQSGSLVITDNYDTNGSDPGGWSDMKPSYSYSEQSNVVNYTVQRLT